MYRNTTKISNEVFVRANLNHLVVENFAYHNKPVFEI